MATIHEKNWVTKYFFVAEPDLFPDDEDCNLDCIEAALPLHATYYACLYWAFVTVTTVGYGDIVPTNNDERLYGMFCAFIGSAIFAFTVGEISAMASRTHSSAMEYEKEMCAMEEFMRKHNLPKEMRKAVRSQYKQQWERGISFNQSEIMDRLSYALRKSVQLHLKKGVIGTLDFVCRLRPSLTFFCFCS